MMQSRRNNQSNRRRRDANSNRVIDPLLQGFRTLNLTLKDLTTVTQDKFLPAQRDVQPPIAMPRDHVYRFSRSFTNPVQVTANAAGVGGSIAFTLNSVPSSSDFSSLFDQYRMVNATVKFIPLASPLGQSTASTSYPVIYTVIDPDDNTVPTNQTQLEQHQTLQVVPNGQPFQRSLTPRAALAAYSGVFTSYASAPQRMWFDCASDSIIFYGLKWFVPGITTTGTFNLYAIEVTQTMEFRHPQ